MGLRFRHSINLGYGFRINLSKTGVGYSWGVPGTRFTKTATGRNRTTISIPGTGISWVKESGGKRSGNQRNALRSVPARPTTVQHTQLDTSGRVHDRSIENADISAFMPAQYEDFIKAARKFITINALSRLAAMIFFVPSFYNILLRNNINGLTIFWVILFLTAVIGIVICNAAMRVDAYYEMDEYGKKRVALIDSLVENLQGNSMIWQITDIYKNLEVKKHAGAENNVSRNPIRFGVKCPPFMRTNIKCYYVRLKNEAIYILPDKLLIVKGFNVGAIDWSDMGITVTSKVFIENTVPKDAEVIGETWAYVNRDGSRDKRFNNNYKKYQCKYGKMEFKSAQGFNTMLYVSNVNKAGEFNTLLKTAKH